MPVNWCEELGTVLSNDEVIDGILLVNQKNRIPLGVKHYILAFFSFLKQYQ